MLKAFTLFEIVVALAISSVLTGLVYLSFGNVSREVTLQREAMNTTYNIHLLQTQIKHEFNISKRALYQFDMLSFMLHNGQQIDYVLDEDMIIRKASLQESDTFLLNVEDLIVQRIGDSENPKAPVQMVQLIASVDDIQFPLTFQKKYGSDVLIQQNIQ